MNTDSRFSVNPAGAVRPAPSQDRSRRTAERFLEAAFNGTQTFCQRRPDQTVMHAEIQIGDSLIMLGQADGAYRPRSAALYLWVENVDQVYAKAIAAGATSESAPEDKPYGHRNAGVVDMCGVTWWIGSPIQ